MATRLALPAALAGVVLGILAADARTGSAALAIAVAAVVTAAVAALARRPGMAVACAALALGLVLGAWRGTGLALPAGPGSVAGLIGTGELRLVGTVVDDPRPRGSSQQVVLEDLEAARLVGSGHPVRGRLLATLPRSVPLAVGNRVAVVAAVEAPAAFNGFDYPAYLARQGISALVRVRDARVLEGPSQPGPAEISAAARRWLLDGLDDMVPEPEAALGAGILLGVRTSIAPEVATSFATAGLTHVVAISGWNIAIVAAIVASLARPLEQRRGGHWLAPAAAGAAIAGYVLLTGASPSVVRAALMAGAMMVARLGGSRAHAASALALPLMYNRCRSDRRMPAYGYLRKSVVHDASREVSPAMQEAAVQELAGRHGDNHGSLVVLSDLDKSGRLGREKRPGYDALLTAIEGGQCTAVYSYSLSRLGRSVQELARLIADCDKRGIPVRLVRDAIDTSTASGKAMAHMLMTMAQFESDVASERQLDANSRKRTEGRRVGTAKFYGDAPGEDPAIVLAAFHEAGSYNGAARLLNERGIQPRGAKTWWSSSVRVVVQRLDPSVIVRREERSSAPIVGSFLLSRLLRCPGCGAFLTANRPSPGNGTAVRYACRRAATLPHGGRHSIAESAILPAIRAEAERLSPGGSVVQTAKGTSGDYDALLAKRARVVDSYVDGKIDKAGRDERLAVVDAQLEKVQDRRILLIRPRLPMAWGGPDEDVAAVNKALRDLWSEITLNPETFQPVGFTWRVPEWRGRPAADQGSFAALLPKGRR